MNALSAMSMEFWFQIEYDLSEFKHLYVKSSG